MADNVPYTPAELAVVHLLLPGAAQAIRIKEIKKTTQLQDREIKEAVRGLRMRHHVAVGASRRPPYGYFILDTAEEIEDSFRTLMGNGIESIRAARSLPGIGQKRIREALGQAFMEFAL